VTAVRKRDTDVAPVGQMTRIFGETREPPAPAGRVCAREGCDTILSRWNADYLCALHAEGHRWTPESGTIADRVMERLEWGPATFSELWALGFNSKAGLSHELERLRDHGKIGVTRTGAQGARKLYRYHLIEGAV